MKKNLKKIIVIATCLTFLLTIGGNAIAVELKSDSKDQSISEKTIEKTFTIYRYGLNGEIEPFKVTLDLKKGEDISKALEKKCEELFENDAELQTYISKLQENNSNSSFGFGLYNIKSRGKGFHFKTKLFVKIIAKFILLKLKLPHIKVLYKRRTVFCNYKNDINAETNITPILPLIGDKNNTLIKGNHSILVRNFKGYTTWLGRFAFTPFLPRSFCGIATSYLIKY